MADDIVLENAEPQNLTVTLGGSNVSYKPGELLGYSSGWVKALATVGSIVDAEFICGGYGKSGDTVPVYRRAIFYDPDAPYTTGAVYYVGETGNGEAGGITATKPSTTGDLEQKVGIAISTSRVVVELSNIATRDIV